MFEYELKVSEHCVSNNINPKLVGLLEQNQSGPVKQALAVEKNVLVNVLSNLNPNRRLE